MKDFKKLAHNFLQDVKYGAFLGGNSKTRFSDEGAYDTVNTDYDVMPHLFNGLIQEDDVLVDVGCGKGRVINWWLENKVGKNIIGIELDPTVANKTAQRLDKYGHVEILTGSVIDLFPKNGSLFFLYNPFDENIMEKFKDVFKQNSKDGINRRIIYFNPEHLDVFLNDKSFEIQEIPLPDIGVHHDAVVISPTH